MQSKTWYYEKWGGRQASFSTRRYVKELYVPLVSLGKLLLGDLNESEKLFKIKSPLNNFEKSAS